MNISNIIKELIDNLEQIYLMYQHIVDVKYQSDEYYSLIGKLAYLTKKENDIIEAIPKNKETIEIFDQQVRLTYKKEKLSMYNFILNRFDSIICNLYARAEKEELKKGNIIVNQDNINVIYDELYYNFILRLNEVIGKFENTKAKRRIRKIQLSYIFSFKNISDSYINNNLDIENDLIEKREDKYQNDLTSYNAFLRLKNYITFNLCKKTLKRNIEFSKLNIDFSNNIYYLSNNLLFRSILIDINDSDFISLKNDFDSILSQLDQDNYITKKLIRCFEFEYNRRLSENQNETTQSLEEKVVDNLINLLKIENYLYDKLMIYNLDNPIDINKLAYIVEYEKDLVNNTDINIDNLEKVLEIVSNDIDFFIETDNLLKRKAIIKRIKNQFNIFDKVKIANGIIEKNYKAIINNHIVDSIKKYNGNDLVIKYNIFMYPNLTDDLVLLNGNYRMIDRFDDELTAYSLNNENIYEYHYDKNKQLFNLFIEIVEDLERYSDFYLTTWQDMLEFKLCELSDIIDNINLEYLYKIKEEVNNITEETIKYKILSLFN